MLDARLGTLVSSERIGISNFCGLLRIFDMHLHYSQAFLRVAGERSSTKTESLRDHSLKRGRISSRSTTVLYSHVGIFELGDCFYCAWYVSKVVYNLYDMTNMES